MAVIFMSIDSSIECTILRLQRYVYYSLERCRIKWVVFRGANCYQE